MSKKWIITLIGVLVLLSVVVFMTPALANGGPVLAPVENTLSQDQIVEPSAPSQTGVGGIISSDVVPGDYIILLKIDGILGESSHIQHETWVDLLSFSWGLSQPATAMTSGAGSSRVQILEFCFSHLLDKASPKLMSACGTGVHLKEAILELYTSGENGKRFYQLVMYDIVVSKVNIAGNTLQLTSEASVDQVVTLYKPIEDVAFSFTKIEWTYWQQNVDGSMSGPIKGSLDMKKR